METQTGQEKWLVDGPTTIDVDGIRDLKIGLVSGQVDVIAHDEPVTRVEVHSVVGKSIKVVRSGDRLEIAYPDFRWDGWMEIVRNIGRSWRVEVSVLVPRETALRLGVVSAGALVSGLAGPAHVSTVSGDVVLDGVTGDAQLDAVSGELAVSGHRGRISAHTVSGDITASGALSSFSSDGVSGNVFLDVTGVPDELRVNTVSGTVTVRLDEDAPTSYTINTVGGRVRLDGGDVATVKGGVTGRFGSLDRHWIDFRVSTVGGTVSVLRGHGAAA